jgi:photosystem II stability/assembly factor-like uncharacterized protein
MFRNLNRFKAVFILALVVFVVSFLGYLTNDPDPDVLDAGNNISQTQNVGYDVPVHTLQMDTRGGDTITLNANPGPPSNGGSAGWAMFLDLIAGSNNITVTRMSTGSTAGSGASYSVIIYTRSGTALGGPVGSGPGSSSAGWTLLDTVPVTQGPTAGGISLVFQIPPVEVLAGDTVGVAIQFIVAGPRYTGTGPYTTYSDANISLITGDVRSVPFNPTGSWFSSRVLCGEIGYVVDAPPVSCVYNWTSQVSGTTNAFNTVKSVNNMIGWAGGASATVRRTTDGGVTWTDGNPNPGVINGTIYAIESFGADTAWCTTSPGATFIYRTVNGGTNWTQVHTQTGGFWNVIKFKNPTTGFIQGDPVGGRWSLWRTTDAGATWDSSGMFLPQNAAEAGWNNSASLIGDNIWFGTNNTRVYYSSDFGSSWTSGPTTGSLNGYSTHFNSPLLGLAGGTAIVKTTDGGVTYSAPITVPGAGNILGIGGDGDNFWCGRGAVIYGSTDAGDTWANVFTPTGTVNGMNIVKTGDCATGWAVGATGSISKLDGVVSGLGNGNTPEIPSSYKLDQNYPNPFNPTTKIKFALPKAGLVSLKVYDMLGREVQTLINQQLNAGEFIADFDGANLSSGTYFYRLQVGDFVEIKKMVLLK